MSASIWAINFARTDPIGTKGDKAHSVTDYLEIVKRSQECKKNVMTDTRSINC